MANASARLPTVARSPEPGSAAPPRPAAAGVESALPTGPTGLRAVLRSFGRKPLGVVSAAVLALIVLAAAAAPVVSPHDPFVQDAGAQAKPPSLTHPMGTDHLGRDVFSRVLHGGQVSLWVGLISVALGVVGGAGLGLVSGYFGGQADLLIQRLMDIVLAFPGLVLALALMAVLGTSLTNVMLAIGVVMTPGVARVVRSVVLSLREQPFVEAARCLGSTDRRIIARHILPNTAAPIIVLVSVYLGSAILIEASLSFLGLGAQPPTPSWGNMLSGQGRQYFETAPWIALFPGLALSLTVLALNLLGDALRDILDPRLRGAR